LVTTIKKNENLARFTIQRLIEGLEIDLKDQGAFIEPRLAEENKDNLLGLFDITRGDNFDMKVLAKEASRNINKNLAIAMYNLGKGAGRSLEILCDRLDLVTQKRMFVELFETMNGRPTKFLESTMRLGVSIDNAPLIISIFTIIIYAAKIKLDILNKINAAVAKNEELTFEDETFIDWMFSDYCKRLKNSLLKLYKADILNYRINSFTNLPLISVFDAGKDRKKGQKLKTNRIDD
jgi:hypothetical protein